MVGGEEIGMVGISAGFGAWAEGIPVEESSPGSVGRTGSVLVVLLAIRHGDTRVVDLPTHHKLVHGSQVSRSLRSATPGPLGGTVVDRSGEASGKPWLFLDLGIWPARTPTRQLPR
jgi:hypothetical protein